MDYARQGLVTTSGGFTAVRYAVRTSDVALPDSTSGRSDPTATQGVRLRGGVEGLRRWRI